MRTARLGNVIALVAVVAGLFAHVAGDAAPTFAAFVIQGPQALRCRPLRATHEHGRIRLDVGGSVLVVEIDR